MHFVARLSVRWLETFSINVVWLHFLHLTFVSLCVWVHVLYSYSKVLINFSGNLALPFSLFLVFLCFFALKSVSVKNELVAHCTRRKNGEFWCYRENKFKEKNLLFSLHLFRLDFAHLEETFRIAIVVACNTLCCCMQHFMLTFDINGIIFALHAINFHCAPLFDFISCNLIGRRCQVLAYTYCACVFVCGAGDRKTI